MVTVLEVEGAHCGACVSRIERALGETPGVASATFNLASQKARIDHDEGKASLGELQAAIARAGYRVRPIADPTAQLRYARSLLRRGGFAGIVMLLVMVFAYLEHVSKPGAHNGNLQQLFAIASLLLTLPVMFHSALPIWKGAWQGLRARHLGMDVPVALGILAAFAASVPATFLGGEVYYESIAMFVFFLLTGRYFEAKALSATLGAGEALAAMLPHRAVRLTATGREKVDPASLAPGDRVWIAAGEGAPADGVLAEGFTDFNEALLTGESAPVSKRAGDTILAGSVNLSSPVEITVTRAGNAQTLSLVARLVERAAAEKPRWALLADRVAGHFVAVVIVLAALAAIYWLNVEPAKALPVAIAVLVVSCPCALALATPVALAAGANAMARAGVLVTRARAIETLAKVTHMVFDKTGTLTTGRMRLAEVTTFGGFERERALAIAAALEHAMPHPAAHALVASAPATAVLVDDVKAVPGAGVEASVDFVAHRVGSPAFCAELAGSAPPFALDGDMPLAALAKEGHWLAVFRFDDTLRPEVAEVVLRLRELGCESLLLSGDRQSVVARVASEAGISDTQASASPADKAERLAKLAGEGHVAAMVGDGVNDAPGLARAAVAIALAQGAGIAQSQADLIIANPSLMAIARAVEIARKTRRIVVQNLAWAAAYNGIAMPLAMAGMLTPWMASVGMTLSSLLVAGNALRLLPRRQAAPGPSANQRT